MHDYIRKILAARVYDVAIESPLDPLGQVVLELGTSVHLKREDLQPVFSFKLRGAYNKMVALPREVLDRGRHLRVGWQPCAGRGALSRAPGRQSPPS